ncbi:MAG: hypothetical protein GVY12_01060 [Bacteroidetes bacterium]|nr:hypothetical protein [Bacteroidota bacterium]
MHITSKKDLQHHLGRTGFYAWSLPDGGRLVASGPKAITNERPGRRWRVRHEALDGTVIEEHQPPNWQSAGSTMWRLVNDRAPV